MPLLEQVLEQYPKQVKLVYKNFPLRNHKFAMPAAVAAMAANDEGKFWEFHDKLFESFAKLDDGTIAGIAGTLGLDSQKIDQAKGDRRILSLIHRDLQEAARIGVRGTPTIFVNGVLLKNRNMEGFREMIEKELGKTGKQSGRSP